MKTLARMSVLSGGSSGTLGDDVNWLLRDPNLQFIYNVVAVTLE